VEVVPDMGTVVLVSHSLLSGSKSRFRRLDAPAAMHGTTYVRLAYLKV
jgi:hypothetical protein